MLENGKDDDEYDAMKRNDDEEDIDGEPIDGTTNQGSEDGECLDDEDDGDNEIDNDSDRFKAISRVDSRDSSSFAASRGALSGRLDEQRRKILREIEVRAC
ncbi:unnamed protein product [Anisakis simplex]|uniref:Uncharacterized protein n=1 Tax=Anisakis simplex TaxID=6269 RepID=A0A0M3JER6_ANISI|nr:unnamed protein product [Anisakis simplex]